jgi:hypothetical protein
LEEEVPQLVSAFLAPLNLGPLRPLPVKKKGVAAATDDKEDNHHRHGS